MKKLMVLAALVVAFASCQSNGKKTEEKVAESKAVVVEAGTSSGVASMSPDAIAVNV